MLEVALVEEPWMSARAALGVWDWCPDAQAPAKLKRWLKTLSSGRALTGVAVRRVEECFTVRVVNPFLNQQS